MEPAEVSVAIDVITVRSRGDEPASDNPNPYLWIFFFKKIGTGLFVRPVAGRSGSHKNVTDFDLVAPTTQRVSDSLGTFTTSLWPLRPRTILTAAEASWAFSRSARAGFNTGSINS